MFSFDTKSSNDIPRARVQTLIRAGWNASLPTGNNPSPCRFLVPRMLLFPTAVGDISKQVTRGQDEWESFLSLIFLLLTQRGRQKKERSIKCKAEMKNPIWLSNVHLYMSLMQTSFTILGPVLWGLGNVEPDGKKEEINKCMCMCNGAL